MTSAPPAPPQTRSGWLGSDISQTPDVWTRAWTAHQVSDLVDFVGSVDLGLLRSDPEQVLGALPIVPEPLAALAAALRGDLLSGLGFSVLTGFPLDDFDHDVVATAFIVFGAMVGSPRSQNGAGHLLGHVKNVGADINDPTSRIYQTDRRQTFHTDSSDVVALLCLRPALEGGESMLVSVETTYRMMVERAPQLAARLFEPVGTDRRGEQPEGELPWFEIPVLSWFDGYLTSIYQRQYIDSAIRFADAPHLDDEYRQALDLFDEIMNDPAVHLRMDFNPGDIQFVHNHSLLHDRTGFVDDPDPTRRRHLLRLWLSLEGDRQLPPAFSQRYGTTTVGDRGGIRIAGTKLCVPMDV